ncbi:hypothetical protein JG687_00006738 [Phytophthora cactorum]|uniref:Uncharacterized protein n=1 Tax=Phytophthora cactorum TaxID=29920 RepID=A0A8T1UIJ0_9STRA|nr:hypothetical protein JG687_00006738 [Phytophthora cactorum]
MLRKHLVSGPYLLPFKTSDPLHRSHSLGKRYKKVVPVIQGFGLPFVTDNSPRAILYKRAILSLVLFKPFRILTDLIDTGVDCEDQWLDSHSRWKRTRSEFYCQNHETYGYLFLG